MSYTRHLSEQDHHTFVPVDCHGAKRASGNWRHIRDQHWIKKSWTEIKLWTGVSSWLGEQEIVPHNMNIFIVVCVCWCILCSCCLRSSPWDRFRCFPARKENPSCVTCYYYSCISANLVNYYDVVEPEGNYFMTSLKHKLNCMRKTAIFFLWIA